jgi:hypothetical protein
MHILGQLTAHAAQMTMQTNEAAQIHKLSTDADVSSFVLLLLLSCVQAIEACTRAGLADARYLDRARLLMEQMRQSSERVRGPTTAIFMQSMLMPRRSFASCVRS